MTRRHGFTLVEMLVAMVIFGLVAVSINKVFSAQQRLAVAQVEQASVQSNVRSGSAIVAGELWELASDAGGGSDILAFDAGGLIFEMEKTSHGGSHLRRVKLEGAGEEALPGDLHPDAARALTSAQANVFRALGGGWRVSSAR